MVLIIFFFLHFFALVMSTCRNGSIASLSDPSQCYNFETQKLNFMTAEQYCIRLGGNLVSIHNMFDNIFISGEVSTFFADSASVDFWIGGNNLYKPGIWTWMDQTPFDFNDWDKGQPQNTSGNSCAAAQMQGGRWTADDCFKAKPFVCLTRDFSPTATLSATTIRPKKCLNAWTFWNESCYKVLENSNWLDAEDRCKVDNGSHLVSIHSPEENLFVANLASYPGADTCKAFPQGWIGLFTEDNGTHWKWTDGTPTNYLNWYPTNPIGSNTNFCVYMHLAPICNGKIGMFANEGSQCSGVLNRFICKMKPQ